jgi:hypothetical protein
LTQASAKLDPDEKAWHLEGLGFGIGFFQAHSSRFVKVRLLFSGFFGGFWRVDGDRK